MNGSDLGSVVILPLLATTISLGAAAFLLLVRRAKPGTVTPRKADVPGGWPLSQAGLLPRPERWLAIKLRKPSKIQAALRLHNARSCSWLEGLMGEKPFFIASPLKGWTLVFGSGLPDPAVDVDECFRFVVGLSRKLGQVQFFSVNRAVHHHAWVWAEGGRVVRAYAWAGKTLWTQGLRTLAERELGLKCFGYIESPDSVSFDPRELVVANVDKVPRLAARWSLDPAHLRETCLGQAQGIAGERS